MSGTIRLNGSSSGYVELTAPAVAGSTSLELPLDSLQPGLVHLHTESFSGVSSVSVDDVFSSTYDNYRIMVDIDAASAVDSRLPFRLRASGTDATSADYSSVAIRSSVPSVTSFAVTEDSARFAYTASGTNTAYTSSVMDLFAPALAKGTNANGLATWRVSSGSRTVETFGVLHNVASAYDGFTLLSVTGTITGTLRIYGYRNN